MKRIGSLSSKLILYTIVLKLYATLKMNAHKRNDKRFNISIIKMKTPEIKISFKKQKHVFPYLLPLKTLKINLLKHATKFS